MEGGTKNPVLDLEALRVSISRTPSVLVILSTITAYIVKVFDKKPASFEVQNCFENLIITFKLVEKNVLFYISEYISPESFGDSIEFSITVLLLWLSYSLCYNLLLRWTLTYKVNQVHSPTNKKSIRTGSSKAAETRHFSRAFGLFLFVF